MQFSTKQGSWQTTFYFQHGNAEIFVAYLKNHVKTAKTRYDRNTYVVVEPNDESQVLNRSFAELDIFTENTTDVVWSLVSNFKQRPYETTMEAFSKLTDIGKTLSPYLCLQAFETLYVRLLVRLKLFNIFVDICNLFQQSFSPTGGSVMLNSLKTLPYQMQKYLLTSDWLFRLS